MAKKRVTIDEVARRAGVPSDEAAQVLGAALKVPVKRVKEVGVAAGSLARAVLLVRLGKK